MLSNLNSSPRASGLSSESLKISNLLVRIRETSILLDSDPGSTDDEDSPEDRRFQIDPDHIHIKAQPHNEL